MKFVCANCFWERHDRCISQTCQCLCNLGFRWRRWRNRMLWKLGITR